MLYLAVVIMTLAASIDRRSGTPGQDPIRLMHVIAGLETAGVQMVLYRLAKELDREAYRQSVVSLTAGGAMAERLRELGIPVYELRMTPGVPSLSGALRLRRQILDIQPDVLQTWMYHSDLLGGLMAKLAGAPRVVWGVHHGNPRGINWHTSFAQFVCGKLSRRLPDRIVCCSDAASRWHIEAGYPTARMVMVRNGFDLEEWRPDAGSRIPVRRELAIPNDAPLVGLFARVDPQKDHDCFLRAADWLHRREPAAHFLLCGERVSPDNPELRKMLPAGSVRGCLRILGLRQDVPRLMQACDTVVCSSRFEAFALVLGEAMATGVPCVTTDVGDVGAMIGDTGIVVPPREPEALGEGLLRILSLSPEERANLGSAARLRIAKDYSIGRMVEHYDSVYRELTGRPQPAATPTCKESS